MKCLKTIKKKSKLLTFLMDVEEKEMKNLKNYF